MTTRDANIEIAMTHPVVRSSSIILKKNTVPPFTMGPTEPFLTDLPGQTCRYRQSRCLQFENWVPLTEEWPIMIRNVVGSWQ